MISNNKSISQSHIQQVVSLHVKKQAIIELSDEVAIFWSHLKNIGNQWAKDKKKLDDIPANFINDCDRLKLEELNNKFKRLFEKFDFESKC